MRLLSKSTKKGKPADKKKGKPRLVRQSYHESAEPLYKPKSKEKAVDVLEIREFCLDGSIEYEHKISHYDLDEEVKEILLDESYLIEDDED